jgi:hypothetical protein
VVGVKNAQHEILASGSIALLPRNCAIVLGLRAGTVAHACRAAFGVAGQRRLEMTGSYASPLCVAHGLPFGPDEAEIRDEQTARDVAEGF